MSSSLHVRINVLDTGDGNEEEEDDDDDDDEGASMIFENRELCRGT